MGGRLLNVRSVLTAVGFVACAAASILIVREYWFAAAVGSLSATDGPDAEQTNGVWRGNQRIGFTLAEAGEFAGPRFASARKYAIQNLREYEAFTYHRITDYADLAARIEPVLPARLLGTDLAATRGIPQKKWSASLARRLSLDLAALNGLSLDQYLAASGSTHLRWPMNRDAFVDVLKTNGIDFEAASETSDTLDRDAYASYWAHRSKGEHRKDLIDAASLDQRGIVLSFGLATSETPSPRVLDDQLTNEQRSLYFGSLAQAGFVCAGADQTLDDAIKTQKDVLVAKVAIVCRTASADFYPVVFFYFYSVESDRWWPVWMTRQSSILMAHTPPPVF